MIVRIFDGSDTRSIIRFLFSEGQSGEHFQPHIVTGGFDVTRRFPLNESLSSEQQLELAHVIDLFMHLHHEQSFGTIRSHQFHGAHFSSRKGANHIWHARLSLAPQEKSLSEETWSEIINEFVEGMDIAPADFSAPACQWVAIRHGEDTSGCDHVHIVANVVKDNAQKYNRWHDQKRASRIVAALERKWGLYVVPGRVTSGSAS